MKNKVKTTIVNGKLNLKVIIKGSTRQEAINVLEEEISKLKSMASLEVD